MEWISTVRWCRRPSCCTSREASLTFLLSFFHLSFRADLTFIPCISFLFTQVIYGDNSSLGLHSPFGFNSAYGQYSPASTPVPQMMVDNQLFSPQQIPVSPQYYPQHVGSSMPHMSAATASHAEMATQKGIMLKVSSLIDTRIRIF